MRRRVGLALAAVVAALLVHVSAAAAPGAVSRRVLANGLTILVRERGDAPVVAVSLQVRGGSHFETTETAGVTNFLQRVLLRGTTKRSAVELAEAAEDLGGRLEAAGEGESAEVRGEALARHWEALLELVAEVVRAPAFAPQEVEKERRLLLSQLRARADNPFPASLDALTRELYGSHPYAWPSLGTRQSLERLGREALVARYRELYRPDRMVLAVSGQVERARVVKAAERLFGTLERPARAAPAPPPVPPRAPARRVIERPVQQAHVLVGYRGPGLAEPAYPAVRVLAAVLGSGMASRLFVELRDKQGLAYSVGAFVPYRTGPAFLVAYLGTAPASLGAAEAGVLRELERLRAGSVGAAELARAKAYLLGNLALDRRTNARQAWYLAFFEVVGVGWDFPERYARALRAVTAEDVAAAAARWLAAPTVVVLTPAR